MVNLEGISFSLSSPPGSRDGRVLNTGQSVRGVTLSPDPPTLVFCSDRGLSLQKLPGPRLRTLGSVLLVLTSSPH